MTETNTQEGKLHCVTKDDTFLQIYDFHMKKGFPLVICFSAQWCGPCKALTPILEDYAKNNPFIIFVKVDIDTCESIASTYKVASVPTTIFLQSNGERKIVVGVNRKDLDNELQMMSIYSLKN